MLKVVKLIFESFRFAGRALKENLLRTGLSLAGVTIGIFLIITVFTMVDSLEKSIKSSFDFLGSNIINVEKWPWGLGESEYKWWDFMNRPQPVYQEYEYLKETVENADGITIMAVKRQNFKRDNNSTDGKLLYGVTYDYQDVYEMKIEKGRYFSQKEIDGGRQVAIIGSKLMEDLFPNADPIGKDISMRNRKFKVIGVMKKEGESMMGLPSKDDACMVPYKGFLKMYYSGKRRGIGSTISLKGKESDVGLVELEAELTGLMRRKRALKPKEKDNFALNRTEALANAIGSMFDGIGFIGAIIGGFSILVGGFGIANIMFVSVKERTNIIGIQKSLGATDYFILFEFLFESIFLSVIGGLIGLLLVYFITFIPLGSLDVVLTSKNITIGLVVSIVIGILAGIIPAALAAQLDPVIAIRTT